MEIIAQYWNEAVGAYGPWGIALMALALVLFSVQMHYYIGLFRRLPLFKIGSSTAANSQETGSLTAVVPTISVIVVMADDYLWVEGTLPLLLAQDHPIFEIIVVYIGNSNDFGESLEAISESEPRFRVSRIKQHPLFPISNKMALNIGIKAARYDNIVITTPDAHPTSSRWLSLMARGFEKGQIVIGYCGIEPSKGLSDKIIRSSRMFSSLLYITAAILHKPYRGTIQNLGFSRSLYFDHKGFGHLNLNIGEDDLFMQQLFTPDNYTIVMHPRATVRQMRWGRLGWWFHECRLRNHAYPFYPVRTRSFIEWEAGSRLLFFACIAAAIVLMPPEVKIAAVGLLLIRFIVVLIQMGRVAKRLGEKHLVPLYFINDLLEPLFEVMVFISRIIKPIREVWR